MHTLQPHTSTSNTGLPNVYQSHAMLPNSVLPTTSLKFIPCNTPEVTYRRTQELLVMGKKMDIIFRFSLQTHIRYSYCFPWDKFFVGQFNCSAVLERARGGKWKPESVYILLGVRTLRWWRESTLHFVFRTALLWNDLSFRYAEKSLNH